MSTMSALTKSTASLAPVQSTDTDTGRVSWAPVFPIAPFMVGFVGFSTASYIFEPKFADRATDLLNMSDFTFLTLPVISVLCGMIINNFGAHLTEERIKDKFFSADKQIFAKAKKKIGPRLKLAMLSRRPIGDTVLFSESDKYNMTHTQATLVWYLGTYYIKIETMNALKTWDLALESVVPEEVREKAFLAEIDRSAKFVENKIREEEYLREVWMYENEEDFEYQRHLGASFIKADALTAVDDHDTCSSCAL